MIEWMITLAAIVYLWQEKVMFKQSLFVAVAACAMQRLIYICLGKKGVGKERSLEISRFCVTGFFILFYFGLSHGYRDVAEDGFAIWYIVHVLGILIIQRLRLHKKRVKEKKAKMEEVSELCYFCKSKLKPDSLFCSYCGTKVTNDSER